MVKRRKEGGRVPAETHFAALKILKRFDYVNLRPDPTPWISRCLGNHFVAARLSVGETGGLSLPS